MALALTAIGAAAASYLRSGTQSACGLSKEDAAALQDVSEHAQPFCTAVTRLLTPDGRAAVWWEPDEDMLRYLPSSGSRGRFASVGLEILTELHRYVAARASRPSVSGRRRVPNPQQPDAREVLSAAMKQWASTYLVRFDPQVADLELFLQFLTAVEGAAVLRSRPPSIFQGRSSSGFQSVVGRVRQLVGQVYADLSDEAERRRQDPIRVLDTLRDSLRSGLDRVLELLCAVGRDSPLTGVRPDFRMVMSEALSDKSSMFHSELDRLLRMVCVLEHKGGLLLVAKVLRSPRLSPETLPDDLPCAAELKAFCGLCNKLRPVDARGSSGSREGSLVDDVLRAVESYCVGATAATRMSFLLTAAQEVTELLDLPAVRKSLLEDLDETLHQCLGTLVGLADDLRKTYEIQARPFSGSEGLAPGCRAIVVELCRSVSDTLSEAQSHVSCFCGLLESVPCRTLEASEEVYLMKRLQRSESKSFHRWILSRPPRQELNPDGQGLLLDGEEEDSCGVGGALVEFKGASLAVVSAMSSVPDDVKDFEVVDPADIVTLRELESLSQADVQSDLESLSSQARCQVARWRETLGLAFDLQTFLAANPALKDWVSY